MGVRVFISYRREDTAGHAGRLYDSLASRLGSADVFLDVGGIEPGADFTAAITDAVAACDVMLVLIGPRWVTAATPDGRLRLEDPDDYVAAEIAAALERRVRVVPVLIEGARMPAAAQLPERIRPLERRNAVTLDTVSWRTDLEALLAMLRNLSAEKDNLRDDPALGGRTAEVAGSGDRAAASPLLGHRARRYALGSIVAIALLAVVAIVIIVVTRGGSDGDETAQPIEVTPVSAPGGSTVEVSGGPCPAPAEGKVPAGIHLGLHDPNATTEDEENPAKGFATLLPGEPWTSKLDIPDGTSPGQYTVYAGCFEADPNDPDLLPEEFYSFPATAFEVVAP